MISSSHESQIMGGNKRCWTLRLDQSITIDREEPKYINQEKAAQHGSFDCADLPKRLRAMSPDEVKTDSSEKDP